LDGESVVLFLLGAFFVVGGLWSAISPRKALESNYAWDRRWTRVFTLGRIDPKPRLLTSRAVKAQAVLGVVFVLIGLPMLFFAIWRLVS
jgi:hypothetical protein